MKTVNPCVLLLLLLPLQSAALDSDREQPIHIEADQLEMREQENISIYEGNVKLVQGSLKINSDRLVIHFNEANELTLMEMTGSPAKLQQLDNAQQLIRGEAEQIDYREADALLILRQSASLDHAGDIINSDLIRFNTRTSGIEAGGKQSGKPVTVVIKPRKPTPPAKSEPGPGAQQNAEPSTND